jgi:hypothetical protein
MLIDAFVADITRSVGDDALRTHLDAIVGAAHTTDGGCS